MALNNIWHDLLFYSKNLDFFYINNYLEITYNIKNPEILILRSNNYSSKISIHIIYQNVVFNDIYNIWVNQEDQKKNEENKKVKYGISIDRYLFDKMKKEDVSVSKFIQNLVEKYYGEKKNI